MTAIASFEADFPGALSKGCLFHFAQSITRKVARLGLRPLVVPHWVTSLRGLTPTTGTSRVDAAIAKLADYFQSQWLPSQRQVSLWNHNRDEDNLRTTNHAEAWHRSLSSRFQ
ncbi:unnamed protein product [Ixodes hexagonus]